MSGEFHYRNALGQFLLANHGYRPGISPSAHLSYMKELSKLVGSLATSL